MNIRKTIIGLAGSAIVASLFISSVAFAQSTPGAGPDVHSDWGGGHMGMGRMMPGVFGTVASVNGTTFTVTSKMMGKPGTTLPPTTYSVDASAATVVKAGATSSVSAIAVGDTVMVQGTVTGSNVVATLVRDGIPAMGPKNGLGGMGRGFGKGFASTTRPAAIIKGNGEPVVGGSVTAISGTTLSVATAQGSITYSVDAANAVIQKGNAASTISAIAVGDKVVVQGTVSGTAITASSVVDQAGQSGPGQSGMPHPRMGGFMDALGGFFHHLFGFF